MATTTPTLAEIDEALTHLKAIPDTERGTAWRAYLDTLLEQRNRIETKTGALLPAFQEA
jgi:hypothetical protein